MTSQLKVWPDKILMVILARKMSVDLNQLSVNQSLLWCYHSNEISSVVLSEGAICFTAFYKMKFGHSW